MLLLNGKRLPYDQKFTLSDGRQFPASWLRRSSIAEKNAIGITEVSDPTAYDRRFYYNNGTPRPLADLKTFNVDQQKVQASGRLDSTDWMIIRKLDAGTDVPSATTTYRAAVREQCKKREDQINACDTVDNLRALLIDGKYGDVVLEAWPDK